MKMKVLTVFGTRPEAIKMAPLVNKLNSDPYFNHKVCVTGQHRSMLDQVLDLFQIVPDFDLNLMQAGQTLNSLTSNVLLGLEGVYKEFEPELVMVHGDTTTTFAATLAAFYANIKVGHVEAGLRTGNLRAPFPEEANRVLTTRLAAYHFAPTDSNVANLIREGVEREKIVKTGNTVIDALQQTVSGLQDIPAEFNSDIVEILKSGKKIILITGHRRENFGEGFIQICEGLKDIALANPDVYLIYPVHLNPNVQKPVYSVISGIENIKLIEPVSYRPFVFLMKAAYLILTDSGGVQEEAPGLGKPVLVMRETTERPEALEAGTVKLVGAVRKRIFEGVQELLHTPSIYEKMSRSINPYGDGKASERIVDFLKSL